MVTRNEAGNANGTSFKEKGNSHRKLDSRPTLKRWFGSRACPDSLETKSNRFRVRDCRLEISSASQTSGGSLLIASAAASALDQNDFPELLDDFTCWNRGRRIAGSSTVESYSFLYPVDHLPTLSIVGYWEPHPIG